MSRERVGSLAQIYMHVGCTLWELNILYSTSCYIRKLQKLYIPAENLQVDCTQVGINLVYIA
jgi:hypothetical protein